MQTYIWITTQFIGFHRWRDAPDATAFLRDIHRHVFHVRVMVSVSHANRDIEFFDLKERVEKYIADNWKDRPFEHSCEYIAQALALNFNAISVEVSEDGENGATVIRSDKPKKTEHITDQVRTRCFVGTEAEGPHRGKRVLFVPGSVTPERFKAAYEKAKPVDRVYFGAGNDNQKLRKDTWSQIRQTHRGGIDIEYSTECCPFGTTNARTTFISTHSECDDADFYKEIASDEIIWHPVDEEEEDEKFVTRRDDPLFLQDTYVE